MKALVYEGPRDVAVSGRRAQPHRPGQGPALLENPAGQAGYLAVRRLAVLAGCAIDRLGLPPANRHSRRAGMGRRAWRQRPTGNPADRPLGRTAGPAQMTAPGRVQARGRPLMPAPGRARVTAQGRPPIPAPGRARVTAGGRARIPGSGRAQLPAPGPALVTGRFPARMTARGPAPLTTRGPVRVANRVPVGVRAVVRVRDCRG